MNKSKFLGHSAAFFCVAIWSVTYISTKVLLQTYTPFDILILRFIIGFCILKLLAPKSFGFHGWYECIFALAGMFGITLYFLIENYALTKTTVCNVGIILATVPLYTAIAMRIFYKDKSNSNIFFYTGFLCALIGVIMISVEGNELEFSPIGDALTVLAGIMWALYCVVIEKIKRLNITDNQIQLTRRIFLYGILITLPFTYFFPLHITIDNILMPQNIGNLLFLGVIASAICFACWNAGVRIIGSVASAIYLYLSPAITVIFAYLILGETLSNQAIFGCILVMLGLFISNGMLKKTLNYVMKKNN